MARVDVRPVHASLLAVSLLGAIAVACHVGPDSDSPGAQEFCHAMFEQASFVGQVVETVTGDVLADQAVAPLVQTATALRRSARQFERSGDSAMSTTVASLAEVFRRADADTRVLVVVNMYPNAPAGDVDGVRAAISEQPGIESFRLETSEAASRRIGALLGGSSVNFSGDPDSVPDSFRIIVEKSQRGALIFSLDGLDSVMNWETGPVIFDRAAFLGDVLSLERLMCRGGYVSGPTLT